MKLTKTHKQIPTIKINKNLLEDLCKTMDSEFKNVNHNLGYDNYGVEYAFSNADSYVKENDSKLFLENVPIEIGNIDMSLRTEKGNVNIKISNSEYYDWNRLNVSGEDSTWVFGITKKLEQIFHKYKTNNHIFHSKKGWGIYALCGIGVFFALFIPLSHLTISSDSKTEGTSFVTIAFVLSGTSMWAIWPYIFKKTFPILELENSLQSKLKKAIPPLIIGIIASVIVSALFLFVGH